VDELIGRMRIVIFWRCVVAAGSGGHDGSIAFLLQQVNETQVFLYQLLFPATFLARHLRLLLHYKINQFHPTITHQTNSKNYLIK
jgi:hypothetical protein